jgi:hypothetical protein
MTTPRKPNFFIVGAPKCGTTSLYDYLQQHDEIFMPAIKEPHYFATDLEYRGYVRDRAAYYRLFSGSTGQLRLGEASVWYLYSEQAAANIRAEVGEAKIVVMLRNPVDMLYSLHNQFLVSGAEDIADFVTALDAEGDRRCGRRLPRTDYDVKLLEYSRVVDFAPQLERYFDTFGRENVHVVLYDDFKLDSENEYRRCLEFLKVDASFGARLEVLNRNKRVRSLTVQSLLRRPSPTVRSVVRAVVPSPIRRRLIRGLTHMNTSEQPRPPLDPATRSMLAGRFRPQIERLAELLDGNLSGWDLSGWLDPFPTTTAA